jgi:hypothetical protein
MATKRQLVGRKIVDVDWGLFNTGVGRGKKTATQPRLTLDNGARVYFVVEETEVGEYGVTICCTDPRREKIKP